MNGRGVGSGDLLVAVRWLVVGSTFGWWLCSLCVVAIMGSVMVVSDMALVRAQDQHAAALAAGGNVVVISSDAGALDAAECAQLAGRSDVVRSGSVLFGEPLHSVSAPGVGIVLAAVDPEFLAIVSDEPRTSTPGVILAREAGRAIGVVEGSVLTWTTGASARVAAVVDVSARAPALSRTAFALRAPTGRANECWVEVAPGRRVSATSTLVASMPSAVGAPMRALLDETPEEAVDGTLLTVVKWTPVFGAASVGLVVALSLVMDRGGLALLRILGLDRRRMVFLGGLRYTVMWGVCLPVATLLALTVLLVGGVRVVEESLTSVVPACCVVVLGGVAGYARTPRNLLVRLRDR